MSALLLSFLVTAEDALALPESCEVSSVGAGWAGVYFAFRHALNGQKVCIFESSKRIGGRTYSHRLQAAGEWFTLDVGAYRFSPDMHLPGDVINLLGFKTACYEPSCPPASKEFPPPFTFNYTAPLRRIVDEEGMPAGYVTAIRGMVDRILASGGQLFIDANLTDLQALHSGEVRLKFGSQSVLTKMVLLNLGCHLCAQLPQAALCRWQNAWSLTHLQSSSPQVLSAWAKVWQRLMHSTRMPGGTTTWIWQLVNGQPMPLSQCHSQVLNSCSVPEFASNSFNNSR